MMDFNYHRPKALSQALDLLDSLGEGARVMAGGTDLMIYLRGHREKIEHVIDITYLPDLDFVRVQGEELCLGPMVTHSQVARSDLVRKHAGLLAKASAAVGSPQVRNRGTLGGNVANAAVCADTVAPLVALGASVKLEKSGGERWLPLAEFIQGPNSTQRQAQEMLTEIRFAKLPETAGWGFVRLARREALAIARMNVGVVIDREEDGTVKYASIAPGSVLPSPDRIPEAETLLLGQCPDEALIRRAGEAVAGAMLAAAGRRWSTEYKEPVIIALVERAIKQALGVEWK